MLGPYRRTYIEFTKSEHLHGGADWEFGTCLWSPSRYKDLSDHYALMREPVPGDLVIHFYKHRWPDGLLDTRICGKSTVESKYREVREEPPSPGDWAGRGSYYRIDLKDYKSFPRALPLSTFRNYYKADIKEDIEENNPRHYPFDRNGRTNQGTYLSKCTPKLYDIIREVLNIEETQDPAIVDPTVSHSEYAEARRLSRERYYFARNPRLVTAAKKHYGYVCQACGFNFRNKYGELGDRYIECHHLNPISVLFDARKSKRIKTSLEEVTVLCSNCHRMVHRHTPALSVEDLKKRIEASS